ncbi:hypothetical protein B0I35DRAFT_463126 [Stachybotrys elegans]|uniref:Uncharacterized protein n=1 Tax=Stachybotrys elegans TaxID=80388 RepID=A0A8K0WNF2_9HYPO|nr:hypothetical protein B0I35DRAFT_463126 [Stachybotrys elegans]
MPSTTNHIPNNSLYLVAKVPQRRLPWPNVVLPRQNRFGQDTFGLAPPQRQREDWEWGIYYHQTMFEGVYYALRPNPAWNSRYRSNVPRYFLSRSQVVVSPRLSYQIVGLIRVITLPPNTEHNIATDCLDKTINSVIWNDDPTLLWCIKALTIVQDWTRATHEASSIISREFNEADLTSEAVLFALNNDIPGSLGICPRPILVSDFEWQATVALPKA